MAIRDGVSKHDDGGGIFGGIYDSAGDPIPVVDLFCVGQVGCGGHVTVSEIGSCAGAGMASLLLGGHVQVKGDRQVGERGDGIGDGIGNVFGAGGNVDVVFSGEGQGAVTGGVDFCGGGGARVRGC